MPDLEALENAGLACSHELTPLAAIRAPSICVSRPAGKTVYKGRSICIDKLDGIVAGELIDRLLAPQRLSAMLASLASGRAAVHPRLGHCVIDAEVRHTPRRKY